MAYTTGVLKIEGKVLGDKAVSFALGRAPHVFEEALTKAFLHEKKLFIGKKGGSTGVFGRKLERRALWGGRISARGSTWSKGMIRLFKGWTSNRGLNKQLQMGVLYNQRKQVHEWLEALSTGMTITSKSGRGMVLPMYKNIQALKSGGEYTKMSSAGTLLRRWGGASGTTSAEGLVRIQHGNRTYWYDKEMLAQGRPLSALVFITKPSVKIKKQFDFERDWKKREPAALDRIKKGIDKATERVNAGKYTIQ
jgi:hypothetical protein